MSSMIQIQQVKCEKIEIVVVIFQLSSFSLFLCVAVSVPLSLSLCLSPCMSLTNVLPSLTCFLQLHLLLSARDLEWALNGLKLPKNCKPHLLLFCVLVEFSLCVFLCVPLPYFFLFRSHVLTANSMNDGERLDSLSALLLCSLHYGNRFHSHFVKLLERSVMFLLSCFCLTLKSSLCHLQDGCCTFCCLFANSFVRDPNVFC